MLFMATYIVKSRSSRGPTPDPALPEIFVSLAMSCGFSSFAITGDVPLLVSDADNVSQPSTRFERGQKRSLPRFRNSRNVEIYRCQVDVATVNETKISQYEKPDTSPRPLGDWCVPTVRHQLIENRGASLWDHTVHEG